ncbi:MAG: UxaA family hydrolase [Synergistetes bacterium]|nr:UxaA family hydrolase [Synergistota bacterium]MDW8191656.1 UxaA family hydrolase [Synergistota bacterium]
MKKVIVMSELDNVATALESIDLGEGISVDIFGRGWELKAKAPIPFGHKIAIRPIKKGENVIKYGEVIGVATEDIDIGDWVHVHNVASLRGRGDLIEKERRG